MPPGKKPDQRSARRRERRIRDRISSCSRRWLAAEPVAGLAEARRALRGRRGLALGFGAGVMTLTVIPGLNLVASDTVSGRITLRLKNVPWDQALELILKTKGLDQRQVDGQAADHR